MNEETQALLRFMTEQRQRLVRGMRLDPNLEDAPVEERVMFLRHVGTTRQIEQKQDALLEIAKFARQALLTDEDAATVTEGLSVLGWRLEELRITAEWAEGLLADEGLSYDAVKDAVKALPDPHAPNRPKELLNKEIERAFIAVNGGEWRNTQEIRDDVRSLLAGDWPPDQIDARPGGPIAQAIANYLKPRRGRR